MKRRPRVLRYQCWICARYPHLGDDARCGPGGPGGKPSEPGASEIKAPVSAKGDPHLVLRMVIRISLEFGSRAPLVVFHFNLPSEGNSTLK